MRNTYRFILGFGIIAFTLLSLQIANTKQTTVEKPPLTDNILRSKMAFAVVGEEIARGLNLHTLSESDHWKLRGPVLLEQQTDIHFLLREQYGRIVNTVYFGAALDAGSPSQNLSISPENRPVLYQKAAEIIRDFIAQRAISVIIVSHAPIGIGEIAAIRRLQGEVPYTYEIINSAAVSVPLKNIAALIKLPFITEIWPDSKGHLALTHSIPQIGADTVHKPPPNGLGVTGKGVLVAVVDLGIDTTHNAIINRVTDVRGARIKGSKKHGTSVASVIGANDPTNSKTGVAPGVNFLDASYSLLVPPLDDLVLADGIEEATVASKYKDAMDAIKWAAHDDRWYAGDAKKKADVVNISSKWNPVKYGRRGIDPMSCLIDSLVAKEGKVFVIAAGNDATSRASGTLHPSGHPSGTVPHTHDFDSKGQEKVTITLSWDKKSSNNNDLDLVVDNRAASSTKVSDTISGQDCETKTVSNYEQVKISVVPNTVYTVEVTGPVLHSAQDYEVWLEPGDHEVKPPEFLDPKEEKTVMVPGYSEKAITVGAVDNVNERTLYSSQGPSDTGLIKPEVVAPGNVEVAIPPNGYKPKMGTSYAAPHVSGVAALILDAVGKNSDGEWNFSPAEVKSAIVRGAENFMGNPPDNEYGAGLVKADKIIFGDEVKPHATKRFKITPALLGYKFQAGYLNAENNYSPNTIPNYVDYVAAISWEGNDSLELKLINQIRTLPERILADTTNSKDPNVQQGSNYRKIAGFSLSTNQGGLSGTLYLDVHNQGNKAIRFTGASTQPIAPAVVPILPKVGPTNPTTTVPPQGTYTTWDLPEGAMKRIGKGSIDEIAYSPDGTRLAVASNIGIWIYDAQTGEELNLFTGHGQERGFFPPGANGVEGLYSVLSVSFSPDGKTLASGGVDGSIRLWDVRTGDTLSTLEGNKSWVYSVAFSPDGKTLASGSGGEIRLWDVRIGDTILILREDSRERFSSVAFSPDGKTLASGNAEFNKKIHLWDVRTGDLLHTLTGHAPYSSVSVSFSPDGKTLASANGRWGKNRSGVLGGTIHLWDVRTGDLLHTLTGHRWYERISVSFSPDGKTLASGSGDLRLWDVRTGDLLHTLTGHTENVYSVSFSPDGKTLASGSRQEIHLRDVSTGDTIRTLTEHTGGVYVSSVSLSPDGQTLASGSRDSWTAEVFGSSDGRIRLWDVRTGNLLRTLTGHTREVDSVSFSSDGKTLASGGVDGSIRLWDVRTGDTIRTLTGHTENVYSVAFSPDGQTLASGSWDNTTRLWDVRTGDTIRTLIGGTWTVSSDWQTLASVGGGDGRIRLWDVRTGDLLRTLTGHTENVYSVAFSPDGQTLASGSSDELIRLWDVRTGDLLHTLTGHTENVYSVAFSPDGQTLASGSSDELIRLWDVRTGDLLHTLTGHRWHERISVSFSPDGKTLASRSWREVRLWDVRTGDTIRTLTTGGSDTWSVSSDWQTLARPSSSWGDGTVLLWELAPTPPEPERVTADVNDDGEVNIRDLVAVAAALGQAGENPADVNGDGQVNIRDLVAVAAALGEAAAAPAVVRQQGAAQLTQEEVQLYLTQAQQANLTDATSVRGIRFLEQLLAALTPKETALLPNYPNPFNPETWIPYQLATPADVTLTIHDIQGRVVRDLDLGYQRAGMYQSKSRAAYWDGRNAVGEPVASGVYFYTLTAGEFSATRKLLIRK